MKRSQTARDTLLRSLVCLAVAALAIPVAAEAQEPADSTAEWASPFFTETDSVATTADEPLPGTDSIAEEGDLLGFPLPVAFSGTAEMVADGYAARGIAARRPGGAWRLSLSPRFRILGEIDVGLDVLLSDENSEFRQQIGQLGLNPTWRWVTLHIGDFTRDYSPLTLQGVRVRGGGIDLAPGAFRFSVQGGQARRRTTTVTGEPTFRRNLVGLSAGYGRVSGTHFDVTLVGARDDFSADDFAIVDTVLVDTIPEGLRPRVATRPMEGVTAGLEGQVVLFNGGVTVRGDAAAALTNADRTADEIALDSDELPVPERVAELLGGVVPIRYSSAADIAYSGDVALRYGVARLRGGYEYVGAGYNSLGLPYLINDRQGYHVNGGLRLLGGRLGLQGQYRTRTNNLLSQQLNTVERNSISSSVTFRATDRLTTVVTGFLTTVENDAPDSLRLATRSWAASTSAMLQQRLFGLQSNISLTYNLQRTMDDGPLAQVPEVTTHNVQASVDLPFTDRFSLAPSVSGVLTRGEGLPASSNIYAGFRGTGRFLDGRLRTNAGLSHTISQGRRILNGQARASYPAGWGTDVVFQLRHNEYSAFGDRPAFGESFATLSLRRSF